eukprot:7264253-Lingulodinium_polyedra.AAC.1
MFLRLSCVFGYLCANSVGLGHLAGRIRMTDAAQGFLDCMLRSHGFPAAEAQDLHYITRPV